MKQLLLATLIIIIMAVAPPAQAFDAIGQLGGGALLQDGYSGKFALTTGFETPVVGRGEGSREVILSVSYLYADRTFEEANEVQAVITMTTTRQFFGDFFVGIGGGLWNIVDTEGQDDKPGVLRGEFGYQVFGINIRAGCDVVLLQGEPDIYYPSVSVLMLSL